MSFFSEDMRRDPFPIYAQLRQESPVLCIPGSEIWLVLDYDGVRRALNDLDVFSSDMTLAGQGKPEWFLFLDPPRHAKLRALVLRAFTPRVVANLGPRIGAVSRELLDEVTPRGAMDLVGEFAAQLPLRVISDMLGLPVADVPRLRRWTDALLGLAGAVSGDDTPESIASIRAANAEMSDYVGAQIEERLVHARDDLLTRLIDAEVDGERLSAAELLGFFQLLLLAGSETATNLIGNAVLCFLDHPEQLARVRAEPALVPAAVEEVLRFRSPVQAVFRATRTPVALGGRDIPAGKLVLPMLGAANRDPGPFREPERFDIRRDPNPHLGFGHGAHFCLGAALARIEARVALTDLLRRCPDLARADTGPWTPRAAFHVHGPTSLPVRFTPTPRGG